MDLRADQYANLSATTLELVDVDMKAVAATATNSTLLDWRNLRAVRIVLIVDNTGAGTTGLATIRWRPTNSAGTALHTDIDIATSINTKADTVCVVSIAEGMVPDIVNGTIGVNASACRPWGFGYIRLVVQEQNNSAGAVTADVFADIT